MLTKLAYIVIGFVLGLVVAQIAFVPSHSPVVSHRDRKLNPKSTSTSLVPPKATVALNPERLAASRYVLQPPQEQRFHNVELGDDLREIVEQRLVRTGEERIFNFPDGTLGVEIPLYDGEKASRLFSAEGMLIGEAWKLSDGTDVSRDFYPDGPIKGLSLKRRDGSSLLISFTEMGLQKLRVDGSIDGKKVVTEFNDRGAPIGHIEIDTSGHATRR